MVDFIEAYRDAHGVEPICTVSRRRRHRSEPGGERRSPPPPTMIILRRGPIRPGYRTVPVVMPPCGPTLRTGRWDRPARKVNRGSLPKHLPRVEEVIEPVDTTCICGSERHAIEENISERLDVIPAQFRVIAIRRPKYACRSCEDGVVQSPAPAGLIHGSMPTEAKVAHVLVSKYADHLPLYRQAQIYARQGIDLDRSTLAGWVGRAAFELCPVSV